MSQPIYILGVHSIVHDSSACLLKDGVLIAAAEEERFTRRKHTGEFPINAINYCLKEAGVSENDVNQIGISYNPYLVLQNTLRHTFSFRSGSFDFNDRRYFIKDELDILKTVVRTKSILKSIFKNPNTKFHYLDHHDTHIASCFYTSPFSSSAILTVDGYGESASTVLARGDSNKIEIIDKIYFPNSLGLVYNAITSFLGFKADCDEGKVMGLASYGRPTYEQELRSLIIPDSWRFRSSLELLDHSAQKVSKRFIDQFGSPRSANEEINEHHKNIAASVQKLVEDSVISILDYLHTTTKEDSLCLAGGVALNCVMNGKIKTRTKFKNVFVQPAAGDSGTSIGSALHINYKKYERPRNYTTFSTYLGPKFENEEIHFVLEKQNLKFSFFHDIEKVVAQLLNQGAIIAWFQGRMEFGPRALGNRSILADPRSLDMKRKLNAEVKFREMFRPYGAVILEENISEYFDTSTPVPYMTFAFEVNKQKIDSIPAVVHVDGTCRAQSISKLQNARLWRLLTEFNSLTNVPVLLNTSFNVMDEPIVNTPQEAVNCFHISGLDYLAIGNYLLSKGDTDLVFS